ncbi:hypothetical protein RYX36_023362 [Vicia faba]
MAILNRTRSLLTKSKSTNITIKTISQSRTRTRRTNTDTNTFISSSKFCFREPTPQRELTKPSPKTPILKLKRDSSVWSRHARFTLRNLRFPRASQHVRRLDGSQQWHDMNDLFEAWVRSLDKNGKPNKPDVNLFNHYLRENLMIGVFADDLLDLATDQNKALCLSWNLCIFIAEVAIREDTSKLAYYGLEFMARWIVKGERARPPKRSDDGHRFFHPLEKLSVLDFVDKDPWNIVPLEQMEHLQKLETSTDGGPILLRYKDQLKEAFFLAFDSPSWKVNGVADHLLRSLLGSQIHYYPIDLYKCVLSHPDVVALEGWISTKDLSTDERLIPKWHILYEEIHLQTSF